MSDDIIRMARKAGMSEGLPAEDDLPAIWTPISTSELERFAALVAAAEREACAKVAEERWLDKANCTAEEMYELQKKSIADAIRTRREQ